MTMRATRVGDVLFIAMAGIFTLSAARRLRGLTTECLAQADARAVVFDLTAAKYCLTPMDWAELAEDDGGIGPPCAAVIDPEHLEDIDAYCDRMAERGALRIAFTDAACALAWAASCRVHWARRPTHARPSQSPSEIAISAVRVQSGLTLH